MGIRAPKIRVIDSDGQMLGILSVREAVTIAEQKGFDLVEVSPNADPPVCRIMDYGKYKYQVSKKAHDAKKKQTVIHLKEVKMTPKTGIHDFDFKIKHIKRFLEEGNKAKVNVVFKGREITHTQLGRDMLERVKEEIKDVGVIEQPPKLEGKSMTMVISPIAK